MSSRSTSESKYTFRGELKGIKTSINALVFSEDGRLLLSGDEQGCVRVWNTAELRCDQVMQYDKWGPISVLTWVTTDEPSSTAQFSTSICVGTARGSISLCPLSKDTLWFFWKHVTHLIPWEFNQPIESQAYDPHNRRLVIANRSGQLKMFTVENCTTLNHLWTVKLNNVTPRGLLFFGGANQSLLVHGLETGEMSCRDTLSSNVHWTKSLPHGIGNAVLSPDQSLLLVDNLTSGTFDLYRFPSSTPSLTFSMPPMRRFSKHCVFAEEGKYAVCGSDSNSIYIVDFSSGECVQSLSSDKEQGRIQVVATVTIQGTRHFVAGGDGAGAGLYLWEKKPSEVSAKDNFPPDVKAETVNEPVLTKQNLALVVLFLWMSYVHWAPFILGVVTTVSGALPQVLGDFTTRS